MEIRIFGIKRRLPLAFLDRIEDKLWGFHRVGWTRYVGVQSREIYHWFPSVSDFVTKITRPYILDLDLNDL